MSVHSFQLETVNADKIDAACDNLALGEVISFAAIFFYSR